MKLEEVLRTKEGRIYSVRSQALLLEAIGMLARADVGALMVIDEGEVVGILSERDIVREARHGCARLESLTVADLMSRDVLVGLPDDELSYAMSIMTKNHIRHLPVVSGRKLVGVLSIRDVVKALVTETAYENRLLHDYVEGKYPA